VSDDSIQVSATADLSEVISALNELASKIEETGQKAGEQFSGIGDAVGDIQGKIAGMTEALGVGIAYEAMEKLNSVMEKSAESATHLAHTAEMFGANTTELQGIYAAATEAGIGTEVIDRGMRKLTVTMQSARDGSEGAREKLERIGVTMADLENPAFTATDATYKLAASHASLGEKMAVVGPKAAQFTTAIKDLAGGQEAANAEAEKAGALNSAQIAVLEKYHSEVALMGLQWENFKSSIVVGVVPAVEALIGGFRALFGGLNDGHPILTAFQFAVAVIGTVVLSVGELIAHFVDFLKSMWATISQIGSSIGEMATHAKHLDFGGVAASYESGLAKLDQIDADYDKRKLDRAQATEDAIGKLWANVGQNAAAENKEPAKRAEADSGKVKIKGPDEELELMKQEYAEAQKGSDERIELATKIAARLADIQKDHVKHVIEGTKLILEAEKEAADQALRLAQDKAKGEMEAQLDGVKIAEETVKAQFAAGKINVEENLQLENTLVQRKLEIQTAYYNYVASLRANDVKAQQDAMNQIAHANAEAAMSMQKNQDAAAKETQKAWNTMMKPVEDGFVNTFMGMLKGTETFKQGMEKLVLHVAQTFIEQEIRMVVQHALGEQAKTAASAAGAEERMAIEAAAAIKSAAESAWSALKFIANEAAKAFAGAFAATADIPYVGPELAPGAGAEAFAAVTATAGLISAAGGAYVDKDTFAMIHADETVLPANLSKGFKQMLDGSDGGSGIGGPTFHLNLQAMDGKSAERFLKSQGPAIVKSLHSQWKRFNTPVHGK
jgi:hypothetical protein